MKIVFQDLFLWVLIFNNERRERQNKRKNQKTLKMDKMEYAISEDSLFGE